MTVAELPLSRWRPTPARFARLLLGLTLFGVGEAFLVASRLGNSPWTVLAEGVGDQTGLAVGTATIVVSVAVIALWLPPPQPPRLRTVMNAIGIGLSIDATLALLPDAIPPGARILLV